MAEAIAGLALETAEQMKREGLKHKIVGKLREGIARRAELCVKTLATSRVASAVRLRDAGTGETINLRTNNQDRPIGRSQSQSQESATSRT